MSEETNIYEDQTVKITNLRAVFDVKTYPISNITSVGYFTQEPSSLFPVLLIFSGIAALMIAIPSLLDARTWDNKYGTLSFGILFLILGILMFRITEPTYILQIATAAGEVKALQSTDKAYIQKISEALNTAIIQKG